MRALVVAAADVAELAELAELADVERAGAVARAPEEAPPKISADLRRAHQP
jgi:hypothetical protein